MPYLRNGVADSADRPLFSLPRRQLPGSTLYSVRAFDILERRRHQIQMPSMQEDKQNPVCGS